ncbi:alpha/beta hydrolase [Pseudonocardia sp. CNS-139]|nr:alpha/beta hydrolase [Pseudonocardia sp. CNS-139]
MPVIERGDVRIQYFEEGSGFPVLALAPGGMRSTASAWGRAAWNPVTELADRYRVITMDQRNAGGGTTAPVTGVESWASYTADQLAVLDHLGVDRFHVVGMCIGGPFILGLLKAVPERVDKTVVLQTIGRDANREAFEQLFDGWATGLAEEHPEAGPAEWAAYRKAMYEGDETLFSVPDSFLATVTRPMLVLQGDDQHHPRSASQLLASSVPGARLVEQWKDEADLPGTRRVIAEFLAG